jgi:hypothetical protein
MKEEPEPIEDTEEVFDFGKLLELGSTRIQSSQ